MNMKPILLKMHLSTLVQSSMESALYYIHATQVACMVHTYKVGKPLHAYLVAIYFVD